MPATNERRGAAVRAKNTPNRRFRAHDDQLSVAYGRAQIVRFWMAPVIQAVSASGIPNGRSRASARRLRLLSVTGFPSASVLGWESSRLSD